MFGNERVNFNENKPAAGQSRALYGMVKSERKFSAMVYLMFYR